MAYVTGTISIEAYTDTADTVFPQLQLPNLTQTFKDSTVSGIQPLFINIAASGSQTINLNGVGTPTKLYFYSDTTDCNLNFNGLGNILFKAQVPGFIPAQISSLVVTNSSSSVATNVTLVLIAG